MHCQSYASAHRLMEKNLFIPGLLALAAVGIGVIALSGILGTKQASAAPAFGDIIITIEDELGNPVAGGTFTFNCSGSDQSVVDNAGDDDDMEEGIIHLVAAKVSGGGSGCVNNSTFTNDTVTVDGYVAEDTTLVHYFALPTESWNTATTSLAFGHKVSDIKDELGNDLTPDSVVAGTSNTPCVVTGTSAYCPVPLAEDDEKYTIIKDGYVGVEPIVQSNRDNDSDPQIEYQLEGGYYLPFSHTIVVKNQLGSKVSPDSVVAGANNVACTITEDGSYCPVELADDDVLENGFTIVTSGYVTKTVAFTSDRVDPFDGKEEISMAAFDNYQFALRVNLNVNTATVTAGDDLALVCTQPIASSSYYCPVPVDDTETLVQVTAPGYYPKMAAYTDRTLNTDPQETVTLALTTTSTNGGGGGNGSSGTPTPAPTPTPTPLPTPETPKTITDIIIDEAAMLAARADALDYFKDTGTPSTIKIGSGERNGVLFSFREAYGHDTKTVADWVDALSIANGRWPLTVNKTVEARAYVNFRAVYGRDANMKNSTDVNALKMMGYGVLPAKPRNLAMERSAIARFTAAFGFGPSIARHWNVVRAIAYSGVTE